MMNQRQRSRIRALSSFPALLVLVLLGLGILNLKLVPVRGNHNHFTFVHRTSIHGTFQSSRIPTAAGSRQFVSMEEALTCRGGMAADESEDEEEYDDEYDDEEEEETGVASSTGSSTDLLSSILSKTKAVLKVVADAILGTGNDKDNDDKQATSFVGKVVQTLQKMWHVALHPEEQFDLTADMEQAEDESEEEDEAEPASKPKKSKSKSKSKKEAKTADKVVEEETTKTSSQQPDFGTYLSQAYGVKDGRNTDEDATPSPILGGTFNDALQIARGNARLLVVLIPSANPKKATANDLKAIESFLSSPVANAAKRKARKKGETASYVLWGAKAGSAEATLAMKRLQVKATNSKGAKRCILLVAYPAQGLTSKGVVKIAPKVLAQHHCSPPPTAEGMSEWMNELRKRHAKQYATMQLELREAQLLQERKEGYKESVQSDNERKERERQAELERIAKEKAEKKRLKQVEERRQTLLEELPEEPDKDVADASTLSVRFPDGRAEKRRFTSDTPVAMVFNWIDASFQQERERIVLTTMNGKQTFEWTEVQDNNKTLKEAGLGRMVGFRLSEKQDEKEGEVDKKEEDSAGEAKAENLKATKKKKKAKTKNSKKDS